MTGIFFKGIETTNSSNHLCVASGTIPPCSTDGFLCRRGDRATGGGWCRTCLPSRQRLSSGDSAVWRVKIGKAIEFGIQICQTSEMEAPPKLASPINCDHFALVPWGAPIFLYTKVARISGHGLSVLVLFQCQNGTDPGPGLHRSLWPLFGAQQTHALCSISACHAPW